jgi:DNA gyrase inhibitor GyrI
MEKIDSAWDKFTAWAEKKGAIGRSTVFLALYYDYFGLRPTEKLRSDAWVTVDKNEVAADDVKTKQVSGRDYDLAKHVGPHENLETPDKLIFTEGLSGINRLSSTGLVIEIHKNDPGSTPAGEFINDICIPLKPS